MSQDTTTSSPFVGRNLALSLHGTPLLLAVALLFLAELCPSPAAANQQSPRAPAARDDATGTETHRNVSNTTWRGSLEAEGILIDLDVAAIDSHEDSHGELREGDHVRFSFAIRDRGGSPLSGAYPAAWMDRKPATEGPTDRARCVDKLEAFVGGSLVAQPELDLNVYYVVTMNRDSTLSVVDPLFGFGGSKLLDMVFLDSPAEDWALAEGRGRLYVSMPEAGAVAVVDTANWRIRHRLPATDRGEQQGRPSRLALSPDGERLWVTVEGDTDSGVLVFSTRDGQQLAYLPTGSGPHDLAFDDQHRHALVSNAGAGTVSVIDARTLQLLRHMPAGPRPVAVAYSDLAQAAYAIDSAEGWVTVIDPESAQPRKKLQLQPGLNSLRVAPGHRLAFLTNPETDELYILDTSSNRVLQTGDMEAGPDQVVFSDTLAYVRHRESENVLMVPLDQVGHEGQPVPVVDFPGGQHPAGQMSLSSRADSIIQAPGANAVLVANPGDKSIYFYKEGMAAPMGSFSNYEREPRAVLVVDRSLRERSPGLYSTEAKLRRPGTYDVALFLDSPRVLHCFQVEVAANPAYARQRHGIRVQVEPRLEQEAWRAGETGRLRFALVDPASGEPLSGVNDADVLTFLTPGHWQRRQLAVEVEPGLYEVQITPPEAGIYYAFAEIRSRGLRRNQSRPWVLQVSPPRSAPAAPAGRRDHDGRSAPSTSPQSEPVASAAAPSPVSQTQQGGTP